MPASPSLRTVLASAARLQGLVPDAVLVGGSAAAHHAHHRVSFDHDHVVTDLAERFDTVLDHLEALDDWSTARVRAGKIILGSLGDIETGIRQLRRSRPLEIETVDIDGQALRVPTIAEILRVKAWLMLTRNQVRDHLDVAALATTMGLDAAARVLIELDAYYADIYEGDDRAASQLLRQLGDPRPRDHRVTAELDRYKQLDPRWHTWAAVTDTLGELAQRMLEVDP